ncbi:short chain dehydrogenase [Paraburkholderia sp. GAS334]|uniref:short chain dehydrogenase n=1 Tax=Paraburkholderia sp. GAS334 TaxID=3035131 RepID=UPI003D1ADBF5
MRILLVGASGAIGSAVEKELGARHEIVRAGRSSGDVRIDITDEASIADAFVKAGQVDAIISAAGELHFGPLLAMTSEQLAFSINAKLLGQVNLARHAAKHLSDGGSVTLVSGIIGEQPVVGGSTAALVNKGLEGFVLGASMEMPRGIRINVVSAGIVAETKDKYAPLFNGFEPVSARRVAVAYVRSVEGAQTGQVYRVF